MKPRVILSIVIVSLGLLIAAVPQNTTHQYKLTAQQLLNELKSEQQFMTTDQVADQIIQKDPSIQLIDVRTPAEFEKFSLPNAINIPLENLLAEDWESILNQSEKTNIFYSNGSLNANEAWMITRQLGYENNYVLKGGLNYWAETIMNPTAPSNTNPDEEFAKYDFRKGASQTLGGANIATSEVSNTNNSKPVIPAGNKKKKKGAAGGCS